MSKHCFLILKISHISEPTADEFEDKDWTFIIENVSELMFPSILNSIFSQGGFMEYVWQSCQGWHGTCYPKMSWIKASYILWSEIHWIKNSISLKTYDWLMIPVFCPSRRLTRATRRCWHRWTSTWRSLPAPRLPSMTWRWSSSLCRWRWWRPRSNWPWPASSSKRARPRESPFI